jgi:hypothetical protein
MCSGRPAGAGRRRVIAGLCDLEVRDLMMLMDSTEDYNRETM